MIVSAQAKWRELTTIFKKRLNLVIRNIKQKEEGVLVSSKNESVI